MKRTHYTPGGRADHGAFCCCRYHRPHLHRKETTMEPIPTDRLDALIALVEKHPAPESAFCPDDTSHTQFALHVSARAILTELRDLRAARAPIRERVAEDVTGHLAGQAVALSAEELRGLQLMRLHLDEGGHDWSRGTAMADVNAARALLDRLTAALTAPQPVLAGQDERDGCRFCLGAKGGTPGNENRICDILVCDDCDVLLGRVAKGTERAGDTVAADPQPVATDPSALDAATCRRLARDAAEDDSRMPRAPWVSHHDPVKTVPPGYLVGSSQVRCDSATDQVPSGCLIPFFVLHSSTADGIARTRNNLPEVSRQLTAAAELAERHAEMERHVEKVREILGAQVDAANVERDAARVAADESALRRAATERLMERRVSDLQQQRDAALAAIRALLATEPAVSEERCDSIAAFPQDTTSVRAIPRLVGAARQLHALRAGLQRIVGGEPAPRIWAVTPERVEALRWAEFEARNLLAERSRLVFAAMLSESSPAEVST